MIWGFLNGLYQILGDLLKPLRDKFVSIFRIDRNTITHKAFQILLTFVLVCFSWIFFRANSISDAFSIIDSILHAENIWILFDGSIFNCGLDSYNFNVLIVSLGILLFADICKHKKICISDVIIKQNAWARWILIALFVNAILLFGIWGSGYDAASFIYFQF